MENYIDIVFDGHPGPGTATFVEAESPAGESVSVGEWIQREDGTWALRLTDRSQRETVRWPDSGNVARTTYIDRYRILEVEFNNGGVYHYFNVDPEDWEDFKLTESAGAFLNKVIKGKYDYRPVN